MPVHAVFSCKSQNIIKNTNLNRIWRVYLDILNFLVWYLAVMRFRNSCVSDSLFWSREFSPKLRISPNYLGHWTSKSPFVFMHIYYQSYMLREMVRDDR